jgi:transposase-like protein
VEKDGKRRKFSDEYKAETERLPRRSGKSIGKMALELGIGESTLKRWVGHAESEPGRGPEGALKRSEREELVELRRENQRLRIERETPKKSDGLLRQGERVKFAFIATEKANYPAALMCRVLKVSRSGRYAWHGRPAANGTAEDQRLALEVGAIYAESRSCYGSPRVHAELRARGQRTGRERVARLMRAATLRARERRCFCGTTRHGLAIKGNLLARRFAMLTPNAGWVTDITYLWTWRVGCTWW